MSSRIMHGPIINNRILALILALVHGVAGLAILLIASWFIAACAVASANFNYVYPAVVIRGLALLRISSGYGEMWLSHHQLLGHLAKLRLRLFKKVANKLDSLRAIESDKLHYQSQDVASIWAAWVHQNASALISMLILSVLVLTVMPAFSLLWLSFVVASLTIYVWLLLASIKQAKLKILLRAKLESDIEHHIDSAAIWHMKKNYYAPNCEPLYDLDMQNKRLLEIANSLFLMVSLFAVIATLNSINMMVGHYTITPLFLVIPMALLAAHDWFGRTFATHEKLQDYATSAANLKSVYQPPSKRFEAQVKTLELVGFNVSTAPENTIELMINRPSLTLFTGASGCGKSRLMQAIAGLLTHTGRKLINQSELESHVIVNDIAYIEQSPYCLSGTLRQNLLIANDSCSDAKLKECLANVGLSELSELDQWLGSGGRPLSGGELKRLGVARALLSKQRVILLDEPFEALDCDNIDQLVHALNILKQTNYIIIASHLIPETLKVDTQISLDTAIP